MHGVLVRARDVMVPGCVLVDGLITVQEAMEMLQQHNADALLVRKRHPDDEFGIVLLADIAKQVIARDRSPARVNVYEIMAKPVLSVSPQMDVRYCARLFERFGITRAPVIEHGEVLGMVSYRDIVLKGVLKEQQASVG